VLTIFGIYPKIHHVNVNSLSRSLGAGTKHLQTNQPQHGPHVRVQNKSWVTLPSFLEHLPEWWLTRRVMVM
jgi:hypothetical protein